MDINTLIQIAVIGAAHGIKGEVYVKSFTSDFKSLKAYSPLFDKEGVAYSVLSLRAVKDRILVQFSHVKDRNAAEALKDIVLYVPREKIGHDLEEEEYYYIDLIGLEIYFPEDCEGRVRSEWPKIGKILAVENFGAGDLLEIEHFEKGKIYIPFTKWAVPFIDIENKYIFIDRSVLFLESDVRDDEE